MFIVHCSVRLAEYLVYPVLVVAEQDGGAGVLDAEQRESGDGAAHLHHPDGAQYPLHRVRHGGHLGPRDAGDEEVHAGEGEEAGGTEERPPASDLQRRRVPWGENI